MAYHVAEAPKDLVHGALILTPKPGMVDEVAAGLGKFAEQVEANEPETLVFSVSKSGPIKELGQQGPEQVVITMVFKDMAAMESHKNSSYYQEFIAKMKETDKLTGPPEARALTPTGGFMRKPPQ
ncbi:hypothetical protein BJ875DRAFT_241517 [Amylocarpus encephaloides]|uniref:ABM domain-containing protein n=1 Tax=Amylocarpus encephaloides TaxID=45428 RepID=A0A9P7YM60_9HELO|nr:hypothetical protein BJ875DRAFT_241517 [Amylocarpus encephaloides]